MVIVPVMNFLSQLLLQLCKIHHIQPLENVGTMYWISDELGVEFLSFLKELKGEVQGMPIEKNKACATVCFLMSGWIKVIDKPIQCDLAICPTIL